MGKKKHHRKRSGHLIGGVGMYGLVGAKHAIPHDRLEPHDILRRIGGYK